MDLEPFRLEPTQWVSIESYGRPFDKEERSFIEGLVDWYLTWEGLGLPVFRVLDGDGRDLTPPFEVVRKPARRGRPIKRNWVAYAARLLREYRSAHHVRPRAISAMNLRWLALRLLAYGRDLGLPHKGTHVLVDAVLLHACDRAGSTCSIYTAGRAARSAYRRLGGI